MSDLPDTITSEDGLVFKLVPGVEGRAVWHCPDGPVTFHLVASDPDPYDFSKRPRAILDASFTEFDMVRGFVFWLDVVVAPTIPINVKDAFTARMEFINGVYREWAK